MKTHRVTNSFSDLVNRRLHVMITKNSVMWPPDPVVFWAIYDLDGDTNNAQDIIRLQGYDHQFAMHTAVDGTQEFGISFKRPAPHHEMRWFVVQDSINRIPVFMVVNPEHTVNVYDRFYVDDTHRRRRIRIHYPTMALISRGRVAHKNDVSPRVYIKISKNLRTLGLPSDMRFAMLRMIREKPPTNEENGDGTDIQSHALGKRSRHREGSSPQRTGIIDPSEPGDGPHGKRRRQAL